MYIAEWRASLVPDMKSINRLKNSHSCSIERLITVQDALSCQSLDRDSTFTHLAVEATIPARGFRTLFSRESSSRTIDFWCSVREFLHWKATVSSTPVYRQGTEYF